jgi:hypothetical protein
MADKAPPAKAPQTAATPSGQGPLALVDQSGELAEALAEKDDLAAENTLLKARLEAIDRELASLRAKPRAPEPNQTPRNEDGEPIFEESEPHGIVVGDSEVAFVQGGHQFGRDRKYLRDEPKGSPKAFNPKLVGVVRPRIVQAA